MFQTGKSALITITKTCERHPCSRNGGYSAAIVICNLRLHSVRAEIKMTFKNKSRRGIAVTLCSSV